jgi:hypothetical protein
MSNHKTYEEIIKMLKGVNPSPAHPEEMTEQIMKEVNLTMQKDKTIPLINSLPGGWTLFASLRNAMAVAAVFLVGFFILEQRDMMDKLSKLEEEMRDQKFTQASKGELTSDKISGLKKMLEQQKETRSSDLRMASDRETLSGIDSASLNTFIRAMKKLEEENKRIKENLIRQFLDSAKRAGKERGKYKSL